MAVIRITQERDRGGESAEDQPDEQPPLVRRLDWSGYERPKKRLRLPRPRVRCSRAVARAETAETSFAGRGTDYEPVPLAPFLNAGVELLGESAAEPALGSQLFHGLP